MQFILNDIVLKLKDDESKLDNKIKDALGNNASIPFKYTILKKAIDARKKNDILFVYSVVVDIAQDIDITKIKNAKEINYIEELKIPQLKTSKRPVIVGFGPAGMFVGLYLARAGLKPLILERGKKVEDREEDVRLFKEKGIFKTMSNVCFGEGGAGTFSDGKLTTNVNDPRIRFIINEFISHGARKEIYYEAHPHIGSDYLRIVVKNIREEIISLGGEVKFETLFTGFKASDNKLKEITYVDKDGTHQVETDDLVLAVGHSARDTFKTLYESNVHMIPKPFSMGVRVEMHQSEVNKAQYGKEYKNPKLKPAEYKIVTHLNNGRGVYSFCMCPGGTVVGSSTEEGSIVTNGMSNFARDLENANSALLVSVKVEDYYKNSPLDGMYFQEEIEKKAFSKDHPYCAPIQLVGDFLLDQCSTKLGHVIPTYKPGTYFRRLDEILPPFVCESLREGIPLLANKMNALRHYDNVLTGVETRSSSPLTMPRDEKGFSSIEGIYPCGEGAGYAGGITSAAVDGLKVAEFIKNRYEGD
jgi:uncharacterized FAD-dependent dehydrogenase